MAKVACPISENGEYIKSIRGDKQCFIRPALKIIIQPKHSYIRYTLRQKKRAFTTYARGIVKRSKKKSRYTPQEKKGYSQYQSMSRILKDKQTPVFGHIRARKDVLVGIRIHPKDIKEGRYLVYDDNTLCRPFDHDTKEKALLYHSRVTNPKKPLSFDDEASFDQAFKNTQYDGNHSEAMVRVRWNIDGTSHICIFSDSLDGRILAQDYTRITLLHLKQQATRDGTHLPDDYQVPISFYLPNDQTNPNHLHFYSQEDQLQDKETAIQNMTAKLADPHYTIQEDDYYQLLALNDTKEVNLRKEGDSYFLLTLLKKGYLQLSESLLELDSEHGINIKKDIITIQHKVNPIIGEVDIFKAAIYGGCTQLTLWLMSRIDLFKLDYQSVLSDSFTPYQLAKKFCMTEVTEALQNFARNEISRSIMSATSNPRSEQSFLKTTAMRVAIYELCEDIEFDINQEFNNLGFSPLATEILSLKETSLHSSVIETISKTLTELSDKIRESDDTNPIFNWLFNAFQLRDSELFKKILRFNVKQELMLPYITNLYIISTINHDKTDFLEFLFTIYGDSFLKKQNPRELNDILKIALDKNAAPIIDIFVKTGIDINQFKFNGLNLFDYACKHSGSDSIIKLIQFGLNIHHYTYETNHPLAALIKKGHLPAVKLMLEKGIPVDAILNRKGSTAAHIAAKHGHVEILELLIAKKANLNKQDDKGNSPLYYAAKNGKIDVIKLLKSNNAIIDQPNHILATPLLCSVINNQFEAAKYLIEACKADPNITTRYGNTLLHYAPTNISLEFATYLIQHQTDIYKENIGGQNFLSTNENKFTSEFINDLNRIIKVEGKTKPKSKTDSSLQSKLISAIKNAPTKKVLEIIQENKLDINAKLNDKGQTALHIAIVYNKTSVIDYLLQSKADINSQDINGKTPLIEAVLREKHLIVKKLLSKPELKINIADKNHRSVLHYAFEYDIDKDIIISLLQKGANPNQADLNNETPLFNIRHLDHITNEIRVADINYQNKEGETLLHKWIMNGCYKMSPEILHTAILALLEFANINIKNKQGNTPLHLAALNGRWHLSKILLDRKANAVVLNNNNETPFDLAVQCGDVRAINVMIAHTDNNSLIQIFLSAVKHGHLKTAEFFISSKGKSQITTVINNYGALHIATQNGHTEIVRMLLANGANVNQQDGLGFTPLALAIQHNNIELAKLLLASSADFSTDLINLPMTKEMKSALNIEDSSAISNEDECAPPPLKRLKAQDNHSPITLPTSKFGFYTWLTTPGFAPPQENNLENPDVADPFQMNMSFDEIQHSLSDWMGLGKPH